jgi:hypothetical protein
MSFRLQSPASSTGRLGGDKPTAAGSPPPKAISGRHCRCSDEQWRRPATVSKKAAFAQPLALPSSLFLLSRPTQALPWTAGGELGDRRRGRSVLPGPGSDEPSPRSGRTGACRAASPPVRDFSVRAQAKPPPWLAPPLDPDPACLAPDPAAPAPVDADAVVVRRPSFVGARCGRRGLPLPPALARTRQLLQPAAPLPVASARPGGRSIRSAAGQGRPPCFRSGLE